MITLDQAKTLQPGTILNYDGWTNKDGSPARYKVNGRVKTWKTRPDEVQIPVKRGLREFSYFNQNDLDKLNIGKW